MSFFSVVIFILILGLLIFIHELGHFLAAKKNGVLVEEFGLGLPPRIFGKKIGETIYSLNLLPIGGFVKLYGEEYYEAEKKDSNKKGSIPPNRAFINKKPWQKLLIVIGGVIGNFFLGWFLFSILFIQGVPVPTDKLIVDQVAKNSPAFYAGVKPKDIITSITYQDKKYPLQKYDELASVTKKFLGKEILLSVKRNGATLDFPLVPRIKSPSGEGAIGLAFSSFIEKKYPWYQAPFLALIEAFKITKQIIVELSKTLAKLIILKKPAVEVSGPIGIARYTSKVIQFGVKAVLELIALLSFNLAIVNILPFPALDGGHIVFIVYEWITKRKVNQKLERYLNLAGMALLLLIAFVVSINDIIKIYK